MSEGKVSEQKLLEISSGLIKFKLTEDSRDLLLSFYRMHPNSSAVLQKLSNVCVLLRDNEYANSLLIAHIEQNPDDWNAHRIYGRFLFHQNRVDAYRGLMQSFLERSPDHIAALLELAEIEIATNSKHIENALNKVLECEPDNVFALSKLILFHISSGYMDKAQTVFKTLSNSHPGDPNTFFCKGCILENTGQQFDALKAFDRAIEIDLKYLNAYGKSGKLMLRLGLDLKEAWYRLESRFPQLQEKPEGPMWRGEDLRYKRLFLWAEQGIGDQVDFASMLRDLPNTMTELNIECDEKLVPLLQRSFPQFSFHKRQSARAFHYDMHMPIGGIARYLRTTYDSFSNTPAHYLLPDDSKAAHWEKWLQSLGTGLKVGLCWRSGRISAVRTRHGINLIEEFSEILKMKNVVFVNVFYGDGAEELKAVEDILGVKIHTPPDLDQYNNLDETAALLKSLDIVAGIATAPIMLSKAVGTDTVLFGDVGVVGKLWWPMKQIQRNALHEFAKYLENHPDRK